MSYQKQDALRVRVKAIEYQAPGINSFELRPLDGADLPAFHAGAHVDLHLPNGLVRSYSLLNPQTEKTRYVVAVGKDPASRGGSALMHDALRVGQILAIEPPRNNFPLNEMASHSILIAGGIGITPIYCMIRRLSELKKNWHLHYCARTRQHAAFAEELQELAARSGGAVELNFDQEPGGKLLDIDELVGSAPLDSHFYCCGPKPMLTAFERATAALPPHNVHVEYFTAREAPAVGGGFVVELARAGKSFAIPEQTSILQVLLDAGLEVPYSCMEGACAACETRVLEGIPDHRDAVLSREEQASNKTMMICCSGCKGDKLVLDI